MESVAALVDVWRRIIVGDHKSWVLFAYGTCVILTEPADDLAAQAIDILREYGPVHPGTPAGDFGTVELDRAPGWVVTGHHPDVLTYVAPDDVLAESSELLIGLIGRSRRDDDSRELSIIHIEDRRSPAQ
jgi:hypothetical protein